MHTKGQSTICSTRRLLMERPTIVPPCYASPYHHNGPFTARSKKRERAFRRASASFCSSERKKPCLISSLTSVSRNSIVKHRKPCRRRSRCRRIRLAAAEGGGGSIAGGVAAVSVSVMLQSRAGGAQRSTTCCVQLATRCSLSLRSSRQGPAVDCWTATSTLTKIENWFCWRLHARGLAVNDAPRPSHAPRADPRGFAKVMLGREEEALHGLCVVPCYAGCQLPFLRVPLDGL
jgi:hypothetical protein